MAAAQDVIHRQGVERTTLADIANWAGVPLGNVYYYFKTKDELVEAAIDDRLDEIESILSTLDRHRTPQARLKAFIEMQRSQADSVARFGCPLGSLCSELDKRDGSVAETGAKLLRIPLAWLAEQFRAMGRPDADELAVAVIAAYQGAALLSNTFHEPKLLLNECRRLERWIDSIV